MYNSYVCILYFPCPFFVLLLKVFVSKNTIDREDGFITNGPNVTLFCQQSSIVESNFSHCVNIYAMLC